MSINDGSQKTGQQLRKSLAEDRISRRLRQAEEEKLALLEYQTRSVALEERTAHLRALRLAQADHLKATTDMAAKATNRTLKRKASTKPARP